MSSHRRHGIHQSPIQLQDQLQISLTFSRPTLATMLSKVSKLTLSYFNTGDINSSRLQQQS